jgi:hypothetical protein
MTWNSVMGLLSTVALFIPIAVILKFRLATYKTFPALLAYYLIIFSYNLFTENYISADPRFVYYLGLSNNLLDAPLMLTFLIYFSPSALFGKRLKRLILLFVVFELIVISIVGFNIKAITIILGPGLVLTAAVCVMIFIRQTKIAIVNPKALGRSMMAAALSFVYGCYGMIYILFYLNSSPDLDDTLLVYYWASLISATLLSAGLLVEFRRINKLNELKTTRKELLHIYSNDQKPAITNRVRLEFEQE